MDSGKLVKELLEDLEQMKLKVIESKNLHFLSVSKLLTSVQNNIVNRYHETLEINKEEKN